jgi:signal peptidase I
VTGARDDGARSTWERRLRDLDDELASYGATLGGETVTGETDERASATEPPASSSSAQPAVDDAAVAVVDDRRADGDGVRASADGAADGPGTNAGSGDDGQDREDDEETGEQAANRRRKALFDWVVVIGVALLVAFLVRTFVLAHFVVDGVSMASTLHDDDRVFVNKLSYRLHDPNRGDVVVLHQLNGASERDLIKRVIGLPGEEVSFEECVVYIDGVVLQEPYLDPTATTPGTCGRNMAPLVVPDDSVFVMGDNRGGSMDSRDLGPIEDDDLVGRAFVVFWPQSHWQWL